MRAQEGRHRPAGARASFRGRFPWLLVDICRGLACALPAGLFTRPFEREVVLAIVLCSAESHGQAEGEAAMPASRVAVNPSASSSQLPESPAGPFGRASR